MAKGYIAPSVKRTFEILKAVAFAKDGLGISELARDLGMAKSTVHGMTSALEDVGALVRDSVTKRYTLGLTVFELGRAAYSQVDMNSLARPVMEDLMEKTQASVFLGAQNGEHVTILEVVESTSELKITSPVGTSIPLIAGAVGKVLLSRMDEEQALRFIRKKGITKFTINTITEPDSYLREIRLVRERGYATDDEEYILGVRAVASPLLEESRLMGALWAVGFKSSLDEEGLKSLVAETRKAAEEINAKVRGRAGGGRKKGRGDTR
jgi:IclR family transcriptional regulator, KDG regulon repressor